MRDEPQTSQTTSLGKACGSSGRMEQQSPDVWPDLLARKATHHARQGWHSYANQLTEENLLFGALNRTRPSEWLLFVLLSAPVSPAWQDVFRTRINPGPGPCRCKLHMYKYIVPVENDASRSTGWFNSPAFKFLSIRTHRRKAILSSKSGVMLRWHVAQMWHPDVPSPHHPQCSVDSREMPTRCRCRRRMPRNRLCSRSTPGRPRLRAGEPCTV